MRQSTQAQLDQAIERLGGEAVAADPSSTRTATAADAKGGGEEPSPSHPTAPPAVDVGWCVFKRGIDEDSETEHRPQGVVVDAAFASDEPAVVVARVRARNRRQDAFFETWRLSDIDPTLSFNPGSSKKAQAAKKLCGAIYESVQAGGWSEENEALLMAACRLTAELAGRRVA